MWSHNKHDYMEGCTDFSSKRDSGIGIDYLKKLDLINFELELKLLIKK